MERDISGIVFAELVLYIEEAMLDEEIAQVFKLANLVEPYQSRMQQLGVKLDTRVHFARLKQRLLAQFPDMRTHTKARDVLLLDSDNDVVHLARAAQTMRLHMFEEGEPFNGFSEGCQEDYVPSLLVTLVSMALEGSSIEDQMADTTPAALAISQMLKFNCIKHNRAHPTTGLVTARDNAAQETLVPTYVGVILHAHTRNRELVDRLSHLGMSISYNHVLELSALMGNSACQQFHREQGVCSPKMHSNVVTTSAIDNIDHNPSSTTAKVSFHGTAISLFSDHAFLTRLCSTDKHFVWYLAYWATISPELSRPRSSVSSRMVAQSRTLLSI